MKADDCRVPYEKMSEIHVYCKHFMVQSSDTQYISYTKKIHGTLSKWYKIVKYRYLNTWQKTCNNMNTSEACTAQIG